MNHAKLLWKSENIILSNFKNNCISKFKILTKELLKGSITSELRDIVGSIEKAHIM